MESLDQFSRILNPDPPAGIAYVEAIVAIAIIILGALVLRERPEAQTKPL